MEVLRLRTRHNAIFTMRRMQSRTRKKSENFFAAVTLCQPSHASLQHLVGD
jgi:hypothetical protein